MTLRDYLIKNEGKPSGMTWQNVGDLYGKTGNAVRKQWKRILKSTPTVDDFKDITVETKEGIYIICGCVHAPFVNKVFWKAMLKMVRENSHRIKGVILNGDFLDLHSLSAYDRGKLAIKGVDLGMEYEGANAYLDSLLNLLPKDILKVYIYGNHEHRFNKYMSDINNSKLGSSLPSPEKALRLKERGFEVYTDWVNDEYVLGNLSIIHGEFCNVYPTKKYIDVFKRNFLFAHTHRMQVYREGEHVAYNIGSMGDFNSSAFNYGSKAMKKTWTNAFAVATVVDGITSVDIPVWNNNHFVYGGKVYK